MALFCFFPSLFSSIILRHTSHMLQQLGAWLIYVMVCTRLDIAHVVGVVCRFYVQYTLRKTTLGGKQVHHEIFERYFLWSSHLRVESKTYWVHWFKYGKRFRQYRKSTFGWWHLQVVRALVVKVAEVCCTFYNWNIIYCNNRGL